MIQYTVGFTECEYEYDYYLSINNGLKTVRAQPIVYRFNSVPNLIRFVVSTCIPILLPTVFVISVGISEKRLSKIRIACTNPNDILVAGKVKVAFFDKTGTLTKQGLDFHSIRSHQNWNTEEHQLISSDPLTVAMSVCHGIFISQTGKVVGNAVDKVRMIAFIV